MRHRPERLELTIGETRLASHEVDALKGIFIFLIILGHNVTLTTALPGLGKLLYSFHVQGFFVLSALLSKPHLSSAQLLDRAVRYFVPFLFFVTSCSLLYWIIEEPRGGLEGFRWREFSGAVLLGNALRCDAACGLQLYWFLPALFAFTTTRSLVEGTGRAVTVTWLIVCLVVTLAAPVLPESVREFQLWSVVSVAMVWPSIALTRVLVRNCWIESKSRPLLLWGLVFILCETVLMHSPGKVNVALINGFRMDQPFALSAQIICPAAAFLFACAVVRMPRSNRFLALIGRHSMVIFLVHSLVYQGLIRVFRVAFGRWRIEDDPLLYGTGVFALTVAASVVFAILLGHFTKFSRLVFPRGLSEWRRASGLG